MAQPGCRMVSTDVITGCDGAESVTGFSFQDVWHPRLFFTKIWYVPGGREAKEAPVDQELPLLMLYCIGRLLASVALITIDPVAGLSQDWGCSIIAVWMEGGAI